MRISWLVLIFSASIASCTRDITSQTEELQAVDPVDSIPLNYKANCLAYLTADKTFLDRLTMIQGMEREVAVMETLEYDELVAQFVAEYIETYATLGHDIEGFDVEIVFKVSAHERLTNCPPLGMPGMLEPLEIITR